MMWALAFLPYAYMHKASQMFSQDKNENKFIYLMAMEKMLKTIWKAYGVGLLKLLV